MHAIARHRSVVRLGTAGFLVAAALTCGGGGGTPTAPRVSTVAPTPTPTPTSSGLLGGYGTQPCCCGFWTYTLTRGGETTSWTCWGWIEIRTQSGEALTGYTDMEKDATDCPDYGKCGNASFNSTGRLDASGNLTWNPSGDDYYWRQVAESNGCTLTGAAAGTLSGTLANGSVTLSATSTLRCDGTQGQLTLSARGVKTY